jgi:phenylacetate-CoA ligase
MDTPYWNPRTETLGREQLDALQLRKLRALVGYTLEHAPWQAAKLREAGVTPDAIRSVEDVRRIPFLTRDEWMASQEADPPFGDVLAQPPAAAMRYHTTSGTSGGRPLAVLDGPKDWEWIAEMWCYALWGFGVRPCRHGVPGLQLRLVRRLLGRALRRREARAADRWPAAT